MPDLTQLLVQNPSLKAQFDKLPESDRTIIMQQLGPSESTLPGRQAQADSEAQDLAYAQQNGISLLQAKQARAGQAQQAAASQMTTPGQVLREDNSPLSAGLQGMSKEAIAGGTEALTGQGQLPGPLANIPLLQRVLGLARVVNSPAVGAGNTVGTFVQNQMSRIPGMQPGGIADVVPAGAAALTDALVQVGPKIALAPAALLKGGVDAGIKAVLSGAESGLTPSLMRTGAKFVKETGQIVPRILSPGIVRDTGSTVVREAMGQPGNLLDKIFSTPTSKTAYTLAQAQGSVPTADIADTLEQAFLKHQDLSLHSKDALDSIYKVWSKMVSNPKMGYGQLMDEVQSVKAMADGALNSTAPEGKILGNTLMQAREMMINEMDKISPLYRAANRLYRQESASVDIMNAINGGNGGQRLAKLIENHPDVAHAFSRPVIQDIVYTAKQISDVASETPAGGFRQFMQAVAKPVMDIVLTGNPVGRRLIKNALKAPNEQIAQRLGAAVQTYRAVANSNPDTYQ